MHWAHLGTHTPWAWGWSCTYGSMLTGVASPITERTGGVTSELSTSKEQIGKWPLQENTPVLDGCPACKSHSGDSLSTLRTQAPSILALQPDDCATPTLYQTCEHLSFHICKRGSFFLSPGGNELSELNKSPALHNYQLSLLAQPQKPSPSFQELPLCTRCSVELCFILSKRLERSIPGRW